MRRLLTISAFCVLAACHRELPNDPVKEYTLTGDVVSVDPAHHTAMIKGDKVEGWMDAMTMEYPVKISTDMARLVPGARIRASVYQHQRSLEYWIAKVAVVAPIQVPTDQKAVRHGVSDKKDAGKADPEQKGEPARDH